MMTAIIAQPNSGKPGGEPRHADGAKNRRQTHVFRSTPRGCRVTIAVAFTGQSSPDYHKDHPHP